MGSSANPHKPQVLMVSPEPPYPLNGGGAYRTASLLHYFAQFADVDLILISESGQPALLPEGLVRSQRVIALPVHLKNAFSRYVRNIRRAVQGVPPLIDRLSGLGLQIEQAIGGRRYEFGVIEHFWCAPYFREITSACDVTVLDLHNVESVLHERCRSVSKSMVGLGHRRFAAASRQLEASLLPRFSSVLAASARDAELVKQIAPGARVNYYPNSFPWVETPDETEQPVLVFSANFGYHPNIDAVAFLMRELWPRVYRRHPELRLRLVGRGDEAIRHLLPANPERSGIEVTGPVENALKEIARARIVIAPLRAGSGTRIKILEAWAAARAIIATPLAAEGLEIEDGENILLASEAGAFVKAIDRLLSDAPERTRMGLNGRITYENHYSWNAAWKTLALNPQLTREF